MSRFSEWLEKSEPLQHPLAWCHVTSAYAWMKILNSGVCGLELCDVFREELLYLFYGRPAFRLQDEERGKPGSSPVVLLFDNDIVGNGRRIFPFDTGAFQLKMFKHQIHPRMQLADFEMLCNGESPRRHVAALFGSNKNYLSTSPKSTKEIQNFSGYYEVQAVINIISQPPRERTDDRVMAVELQVGSPIETSSGQLKAVIYPSELDQSDEMRGFIADNKHSVDFRTYDSTPNKLAHEYQTELEKQAKALQKKLGYRI